MKGLVACLWRLRLPTPVGLLCQFECRSHQAHRCMLPHFRPPVTLSTGQQCYDSVAGPDVGRSAAGVEFLFYPSNFVVHQLEFKAHKNCRHCLVNFSSWLRRPHTTSTLPRIHIEDFVLLPKDPNWLQIFMMGHTCRWHLTISLSDYTENCLLPAIFESKSMSVTVYSP